MHQFKSPLIRKNAVNETAVLGTSQKHDVPVVRAQDLASQGVTLLTGGAGNLRVDPVLVMDSYGSKPGIQIVSHDGGVCVLDHLAVDDLVLAYTKLKPRLEEVFKDLKLQGLNL